MGLLDETDAWTQLLQPGRSQRWFEAAPRPPGPAPGTEFSPSNAWWLAELSRLAYRDQDRAGPLAAGGLREVGFVAAGGTQVLVAVDAREPRVLCCAFRGTDEVRDWLSNLTVLPVAGPRGGLVHRGFRDAFAEVEAALGDLVAGLGLPVLLGGHSLGGALAQLAALRVPAVGCHTFGAPRVGDAAFAASLAPVPTFVFAHGRDLVPALPPSLPHLRFATAGRAIALAPVGPDGGLGDPPAALADHAAARYVEALRRLL